MPDYQKMYFSMAAKLADAIELLQTAQQEGEDAYCAADESTVPPDHE